MMGATFMAYFWRERDGMIRFIVLLIHSRKSSTQVNILLISLGLPLIQLLPQADRAVPETGIYSCPVYKVVSRRGTLSTTGHSTNFVMFFEIPSDREQEVWIRAGVAAFLSLRY